MEAIDAFDIEIDISDRLRLYDYVTRTLLKRPTSGQWDPSVFNGLGSKDSIPDDDENTALSVSLLDNAIQQKRCLEKKVKDGKDKGKGKGKKGEDTQKGLFDEREDAAMPRRVLPVYKPGEEIKGKVILKLNQPVKADALKLKFTGYAHVNVRVYHRYGYYDCHAEEMFANEKRQLWVKSDSKGASDVADTFALLHASDGTVRSEVLAAGDHVFPFSFVIPLEARQSTPPLKPSHVYRGYLVYYLAAKIDKGKALAAGNILAHKGIWLETPYDIAKDPRNLLPVSSEESLETGVLWKPGKITVKASLPKGGVLIGQTIHLTLEVDNHSSGEISKIEARVRITGKVRLSEKKLALHNNVNIKSEKVTLEGVPPGMCPRHTVQLPWNFSESSVDGNLLPVGTLDDCTLLDVKYDVRVKLTRKGAHRNLELSLPITVGNFNSRMDFDVDEVDVERIYYPDD